MATYSAECHGCGFLGTSDGFADTCPVCGDTMFIGSEPIQEEE